MKKLLFLLMLPCLIIAFDQANAQSAKVLGKVLDVSGKGVAGVKVAVEGQKITATTSKDGSFRLEGVAPGNVYLYATAPSQAYLDGETLKSISVRAVLQSPV
jgi:protocatechuate 3,4-dioxygenase beta subunit